MSSRPGQMPEREDPPWEDRLRAGEASSSTEHAGRGSKKDKKRRNGKKDKKGSPAKADDNN